MIRVVGIDVCRDRVVACLLTEIPADIREFYQDYDFPEFKLNRVGLEGLLNLEPSDVIYEPTGVAYSRVWIYRLREAGIRCHGVDHARLRAYRKGLDLPDKDDEADSLALACYFLDPVRRSKNKFIRKRPEIIENIRDLVLRLQHLDRAKNPIANRLKQDLAMAFPEQQNKTIDGSPLFWGWLAGERRSAKYDIALEKSIGLGVREHTRISARQLTAMLREEDRIMGIIRALIKSEPDFEPYIKVFNHYGFGEKMSALFISQIYPFEDFLKGGKPEIKQKRGKNTDKTTTRYLSLRRFMKCLGVAPVREWSGDSRKSTTGGSALCRKAIWLWIYRLIEVQSKKTSIQKAQGYRIIWGRVTAEFEAKSDSELEDKFKIKPGKAKGVKRRLARAYMSRMVVRHLFKDLVDALC